MEAYQARARAARLPVLAGAGGHRDLALRLVSTVHGRLAILPNRVPQFPAPEQLGRLFHLGGGSNLLGYSAVRGFFGPIQFGWGGGGGVERRWFQAITGLDSLVACIPVSIASDLGGISILNTVDLSPCITI